MFIWILENSLLTSAVMLAVFGLCRLNRRRPALCHLLWILAFASLVMPPVPIEFTPGSQLRTELRQWIGFNSEVVQANQVEYAPVLSEPSLDSLGAVSQVPRVVLPLGLEDSSQAAVNAWQAIPIEQWLVAIWLLGAGLFVCLSLQRIRAFHRRVESSPDGSVQLQAAVQEVASRLGLEAPPIRLIEGVGSPAIWCFGRPLLLWPKELGASLEHGGESSLIAHELAHVARRDHWVSRFDVLAIGLCWWNPLFWIIRREIRYYAELSCDAWALWAYPTCRRDFAEALIDSQERTQRAPMAIEGLCATHSDFKNFERRLTMILKTNVSRQVSKGAATAALLTTLLVLPGFSGDGKKKTDWEGSPVVNCIDEQLELKELLGTAEKYFGRKEFKEAAQLYESALGLDPMNGKAHGRLGYMLVAKGQYGSASSHFKAQFKSGYEVPTAVYNLACASALAGDQEQAEVFLEKAVRRGFTNATLLKKDTDLASLRGTDAFVWALKASAKSYKLRDKVARKELAEDHLTRASIYSSLGEIATEDGKLQNDCGLTFLLVGQYEAGLQAFQRQIAAGFDVPRAHYNVACALALTGRSDAALTSLELAADAGMAYGSVGQDEDLATLRGTERFKATAKRLMAGAKLKKQLKVAKSPEEHAALAKHLGMMVESEDLAADERSWAAFELGRLQLRGGQEEAAIVTLRGAVNRGYAAQDAAFQIGNAHASLGRMDAAMSSYGQAIELGFRDGKSLGWSLEQYGLAESEEGMAMTKRLKSFKKKSGYKKKGSSDWAKESWDGEGKKPRKKKNAWGEAVGGEAADSL